MKTAACRQEDTGDKTARPDIKNGRKRGCRGAEVLELPAITTSAIEENEGL